MPCRSRILERVMRCVRALVIAAVVGVLTIAPLDLYAAAHESRTVGPYQVVVGWLSEPAFAGVANAVDLRVSDTRTTPPAAVTGLEKTLTVEVFQGGLATPFASTFRARFGVPGAYAADMVPTRAGSYRFVIAGKIGDLTVNETFESGPGRFDDVRAQTALQYPVPVPAGAELGSALGEVRALAEQTRLLAAAAIVIAAAALVVPYLRRRAR